MFGRQDLCQATTRRRGLASADFPHIHSVGAWNRVIELQRHRGARPSEKDRFETQSLLAGPIKEDNLQLWLAL